MATTARRHFVNPTYLTTYNTTYRYSSHVLPPIKFNQIPSIQLTDHPKLPPRQFPVIPRGPHRPLGLDLPLGQGLGTKDVNTDKLVSSESHESKRPGRLES